MISFIYLASESNYGVSGAFTGLFLALDFPLAYQVSNGISIVARHKSCVIQRRSLDKATITRNVCLLCEGVG